MKEFLLKQPKATCVLFSIACKTNLGLVKNNGNPGGRGVFGLGNLGGRWGHSDLGNLGGRGVKNPCHPSGGCVDFFWNNPMGRNLYPTNHLFCHNYKFKLCRINA